MAKDRIIRDIRFYESESICAKGNSLAGNVGAIVQLPKLCYQYGTRIARTLENDGFSFGRPDHVYFNMTPALQPGSFSRSDLELDDRIVYVNAGVEPSELSEFTQEEADNFIIDLVFSGLRTLADGVGIEQVLDSAKKRVLAYRSELPILVKRKETKSYIAEVFYKIRPQGGRSVGIVRYEDLKRGLSGEKIFVELDLASHIYPLVGTISVSKGVVKISPRDSFRAQIVVRNYRRPIEVAVTDILDVDGTEGCDTLG